MTSRWGKEYSEKSEVWLLDAFPVVHVSFWIKLRIKDVLFVVPTSELNLGLFELSTMNLYKQEKTGFELQTWISFVTGKLSVCHSKMLLNKNGIIICSIV